MCGNRSEVPVGVAGKPGRLASFSHFQDMCCFFGRFSPTGYQLADWKFPDGDALA